MLGILFALLSAVFFSLTYVLVQLGMQKSNEDNGLFLNICINVFMLGLIYFILIVIRQELVEWNLIGISAFAIAGFLTSLVGRSTLFSGIRRIGSSRAVAIKNMAPIFTIMIAIFFLQESISVGAGIGMIVIVTGLLIVVNEQWKKNGSSLKDKGWIGFIFAGVAAASFGAGQVARKIGVIEIADPIFGAWIGSITALIVYSTILLFKRKFKTTINEQISHFNILFFGAGITATLGLITFFIAVYYTNVAYVSAIAGIEPVLTILFAYLFLKKIEILQQFMIVSTSLIFIGIIIMSISIV